MLVMHVRRNSISIKLLPNDKYISRIFLLDFFHSLFRLPLNSYQIFIRIPLTTLDKFKIKLNLQIFF